jgi:hypothetical protein
LRWGISAPLLNKEFGRLDAQTPSIANPPHVVKSQPNRVIVVTFLLSFRMSTTHNPYSI